MNIMRCVCAWLCLKLKRQFKDTTENTLYIYIYIYTDKTSLRLIRRIGGGGKDSPEKHKGKRAKEEEEQQQQQDMLAPRDPATGITSSRAPTRSAGNQ